MTEIAGAFMTVSEAAKELGVSATTAYRLVASRQIPTVTLRGRVRVPRAALRKWLERRTREALASVHRASR
jgi:excisionase family DNA binding protein